MVFSSIVYLLYFLPVFLVLYYLADKRYRNIVLLVSSIFFYSWGAPKFIFVILCTTFLDFHLVRWMSQIQNQLHRRLMLALSVSVNLGLLVYFKYSNFFVENANVLLSEFGVNGIHWTKLILPIGISFYTFETITYVVDVYRRVHKPLTNFWDYQLYIILFPKLIAGPIIRYHELAEFWQRWHITLGNWMRNYLYIPLGGNRVKSKTRLYFNLGLVFLVSGFWHGASWSFIFWGAYHGLFLIIERAFLLKLYHKWNRIYRVILTFILVAIGFMFFRVEKLSQAFIYLKQLFTVNINKNIVFDSSFYTFMVLAIFFSFFAYFKLGQNIQDKVYFGNYSIKQHLLISGITVLLFILSISSITAAGFNPFIYFRF